MSKDSSAKFTKTTKQDYKKKLVKDIKVFIKNKKKERNSIVMIDTNLNLQYLQGTLVG